MLQHTNWLVMVSINTTLTHTEVPLHLQWVSSDRSYITARSSWVCGSFPVASPASVFPDLEGQKGSEENREILALQLQKAEL